MFRFFRHHSWILIATLSLTIISFVVFMGKAPSRSGGGFSGGDYGKIYGQVISPLQYDEARREFFISYWEQTGEWPDKNSALSSTEIEQEVYSYLIMQLKAKELGIHVGDDAAASAAGDLLRSPALMRMFGTTEPIPATEFVKQVLNPEGLTAADFERAVRTKVAINQLVTLLGLPGELVTPQEAGTMYDREYQEISAQAVFFSASNYLSQASMSPGTLADFYTNNMAAYREPDQVQVNYVVFNVSNYLEQSKAEWAKTNFEETVSAIYSQYGATEFANEKSPEAAKTKIRQMVINRRALDDANRQANDFVSALYAMNPVQPDNLNSMAKQKNLPVYTSAPFGAETGPEDFNAPAALTKAAFQLNADSPYTGPIAGSDAVYVIALARQLPSSIPTLDSIRNRVTRDFLTEQAVALAQHAGTNFSYSARIQTAMGQKFSKLAEANQLTPVALTPFSLSSSEVPELGDHAELNQLKRAAFSTPPGKVSPFVPSAEGGFVVYVQSLLPVDQSEKSTNFPKFLAELRRTRLNEAFNLWINAELNRELRNTPYFQQQQASAAR
ncbi:MAG TPA: SurA N-terminal domain-containing protein [Candidatus Acidoferrum sp.]|nr:SurA N-terminal domain-containing protein [Candidatus Acidoferrum sp.]